MFLPRLTFSSADTYADAARAGLLRPGQFVHFDDIDARFARCVGSHVTTFYWKTGTRKAARAYLKAHGKKHRVQ